MRPSVIDRGEAFEGFTAAEGFARALLPHAPHSAVFVFDREFRLRMADGPALLRAGRDPAQMVGRTLGDVLPAATWESLRPHYERVLAGEPAVFVHESPTQLRSYHVDATPIVTPQGDVVGGLVISREEVPAAELRLTERLRQQSAVAELGRLAIAGAAFGDLARDAARLIHETLEAADGAIVIEVPPGSELLVRHDSTGRLTGARIPLSGTITETVLRSSAAVVVRDVQRSGHEASEQLKTLGARSGVCVRIGRSDAPFGVLGLFCGQPFDFTDDDVAFAESLANVLAEAARREQVDADLRRQALHDPVTGLPNRTLLDDRLRQSLAFGERAGLRVGVIFVDLDHFRVVNDSLGHDGGDAVLRQVADRLRSLARGSDTVARFGGDEFVVIAAALEDDRDALRLAEQISSLLASPVLVGDQHVYVRASIGIRVAGPGEDDPRRLIRDADAAMARAKARGRGRYELADPANGAQAPANQLAVEQELRDALAEGDLRLVFQPFVAIGDGSPVGAEVLLRWEHPTRGYLSPAGFLDVAEQSGLIVPIGAWMLTVACRRAARWRQDRPDFLLTVNLSATQLADPAVVETVERALADSGLEPQGLGLELTEQVLIGDENDVLRTLSALKALGVTLLLDDFGTGFSSLSHLKRFPIDIVKIDRSFIEGLGDPDAGHNDAAIVSALVGMSLATGKLVIPEGIETGAQVGELQRLGCRFGQGYHFAKPLKPEDFEDWLRAARLQG